MHDMMPYQVLAVCADCGLLVCAQEVDLSQNLRSVPRFMRLGDHLQPAGQRDVRETRRCDDLASPQAHALGSRCRQRMNWCGCVSSDRIAGRRVGSFSGSGELIRDVLDTPS